MILAIRTDSFDTELYLYNTQGELIDRHLWSAGKELSLHLHSHIDQLIHDQGAEYASLTGIITYKGPGSFTGLRIGLTVANSLAYGLTIPVVAASGEDWIQSGFNQLKTADVGEQVLPEYGGDANITKPRK